jgi:hypothetical protein
LNTASISSGSPSPGQSEIQRWHPPEAFVDVQLRGPYKRWVHTHRFLEEDRATIIEDEVQYVLPYWPLGELVYPPGASAARAHFSVSATSHPDIFVAGMGSALKSTAWNPIFLWPALMLPCVSIFTLYYDQLIPPRRIPR